MCTTIAIAGQQFCFGRNMDIAEDFGQQVLLVPERAPLPLRQETALDTHYAILGMARLQDGFPLFADAMNEHGLCMAGLNFPQFAHYPDGNSWKPYSIAPFEMIPWVLGQCRTLAEAKQLLAHTELAAIPFSGTMPLTPLHWHIADASGSLAAEPLMGGLQLTDNPAGVLTNSPPLSYQLAYLGQFRHLSPEENERKWCVPACSKGLGNLGLPGDASSMSRFVRAAILREQADFRHDDVIRQCFHLLDAVSVIRGTIRLPEGGEYCTRYRCCMEPQGMRYHYRKYADNACRTVQAAPSQMQGREILLLTA